MRNKIGTTGSDDLTTICSYWDGMMHGYYFYESGPGYGMMTFDIDEEIELVSWDEEGNITNFESLNIKRAHLDLESFMSKFPEVIKNIDELANLPGLDANLLDVAYINCGVEMNLGMRLTWAYERKLRIQEGIYDGEGDFVPYYVEQNEMREKVITEDDLPDKINFIGGVDSAYDEEEQKIVGTMVVLNSETLELVETSSHKIGINFPYIPELYSFRDTPPVIEAYNKLTTKPDIIVCNGHGIAHPKGVGMATDLGIRLNIPTIGCARKKMIGIWNKEKLGAQKGDDVSLQWEGKEVGKVLRTKKEMEPLFISIGHKISLDSATSWVLRLCSNNRLPETTIKSDQLLDTLIEKRTEINFLRKDEK